MSATLATGLLLAGCGIEGEGGAGDPGLEDPGMENPADPDPEMPGDDMGEDPGAEPEAPVEPGGDECYIHFFDGDNFAESDDNFKLTEAGDYENLSNLPGADKDWTGEADSFRVGDSAHVVIFTEEGFGGESQDLTPGSEVADADEEPASLQMTCE